MKKKNVYLDFDMSWIMQYVLDYAICHTLVSQMLGMTHFNLTP